MFFEYTKKVKKTTLIVKTFYALVFSILLCFMIDFLFDKAYFSIIIGAICFIGIECISLFTKKGIEVTEDRLILKNGYKELGRNAFIDYTNYIYYNDILDIEFYDKFEPIMGWNEKVVGLRSRDCHYVVLTIKHEPNNILLYISVENEVEFLKLLEAHVDTII